MDDSRRDQVQQLQFHTKNTQSGGVQRMKRKGSPLPYREDIERSANHGSEEEGGAKGHWGAEKLGRGGPRKLAL